jgi:hypothetical protein
MYDSGRVLACGHEICFGKNAVIIYQLFLTIRRPDCLMDISNAPPAHDGEL